MLSFSTGFDIYYIIVRFEIGDFVLQRKMQFWHILETFVNFIKRKNVGRASSYSSVTSPTKRSEMVAEKWCSFMENLTVEVRIFSIDENSFTRFSVIHVFIVFSQDRVMFLMINSGNIPAWSGVLIYTFICYHFAIIR